MAQKRQQAVAVQVAFHTTWQVSPKKDSPADPCLPFEKQDLILDQRVS